MNTDMKVKNRILSLSVSICVYLWLIPEYEF